MAESIMTKLWSVAGEQHGLFTAAQASELGVAPSHLSRRTKEGSLERRRRGVYRIANAPFSPQTELLEAVLWAHRVDALVTGESTLSLYDLADVNPSKVHLVVSPGTRLTLSGGENYLLHRFAVGPRDRTEHLDVPTVVPAVAIEHCISLGLGLDLVDQAIMRAQSLEVIGRVAAAELTVKAHHRSDVA